mgnify:CR=1 FL=1
MPNTRNIIFTFITIVVIPVLFFALLELGLTVFGVGTSYDYFHKVDIDGETFYQDNPDFADQFYPQALDINPRENTFSADPDSERVRVYILGGSAALGFPHKNHGLDRLLETHLRAGLPSRKVEVINLAMTSINSHVVYEIARAIPDGSADFAVILMGNNEVVGPYGPGTISQNFLDNITLIRGVQSLKRTRLWQALDGLIQRIRPTDAMQELEWEGMQMFTSNAVPQDDPRMASVYSHYEDNLTDIIAALRDKGIHVLLSSVPVNLRHNAPFLSAHAPEMTAEQLGEWSELSRNGAQSADSGNWTDVIVAFEAALAIDPDYADTHFRLATAYENLGQFDKAKAHYARALDLDALRFRADTRINAIVQEVATRVGDDDLSFVDSAAAFEQASQPYLPGWNLLLEHVHYGFTGNHLLAAELSRSIVNEMAPRDGYEPLSETEAARRTGFPNQDTIGEIQTLQAMIEQPPFPGQSNFRELADFLDELLQSVKPAIGTPAEVVRKRADLVRSGLADWKIHFELAVLNQRLRNAPAVDYHLNKILELYPHNRETYMKIAEMKSQAGKWSEVIPQLERSLYYTRGDAEKIAETTGWLGTAYFRTGEYDKATELLEDLTRQYPDQIGLTLRAYGNLVKYSRENRKTRDLERHIRNVQRYAESLIRDGKDQEYPLLHKRVSQIMTMGGYPAEAREWAKAEEQ